MKEFRLISYIFLLLICAVFGGESPGFRKLVPPSALQGSPLCNEGLELGNWEGHVELRRDGASALSLVKCAS